MPAHILPAASAVLLGVAALRDILTRTVTHPLCVALALAGAGARVADGSLLAAGAAACTVFLLAALCWRRGWMGGGDVKLLGAATLAMPPSLALSFVLAVAIAGGVLGLPYLLARGRIGVPLRRPAGFLARAWRIERWRLRRGGPLPYAVAIAAGGLLTMF